MSATEAAWRSLPFQVVICGAALYVVWTIVGVSEQADGDIVTLVSNAVYSAAETIAAFLVGLPLRLVPTGRAFWLRHGWITVLAVLVGVGVLIVSWSVGTAGWRPALDPDLPGNTGWSPDGTLFAIGSGLVALGCVHLWFPRFLGPAVPRAFRRLVGIVR